MGYLLDGARRLLATEEQFQVYRYVTPDQANPHDSLGKKVEWSRRSSFPRPLPEVYSAQLRRDQIKAL